MIPGIAVEIGPAAVVVTGIAPLRVLSSAVVSGGLTRARTIVNLHVDKEERCADPHAMLVAFARRARLPEPWVGLLTAAWTADAAVGEEGGAGVPTLAVATVGLSNRVAGDRAPVTPWEPGTINAIVVVDADPGPAALVNAVMTATEVKALALAEAGIRGADGGPVTGTSTDALVIAATGRGPAVRFGGPSSPLGWSVARAVRRALDQGIGTWQGRQR